MGTIMLDYGIFGRILLKVSLGEDYGSGWGERAPWLVDLMSGYEFLIASFIIGRIQRFWNELLLNAGFYTSTWLVLSSYYDQKWCY